MYTPAVDWTGPDTFTLKFCNVTNCPANDFLTANVTVTVGGEAINITNASVPNGTVGTLYSQQTFAATEGYGAYTFAVTSGALPAGLTLTSAGILSGTPTAGGIFNFTVTASDSTRGTGPLTGAKAFSMTIAAPTISVTPTTIPDGTQGTTYGPQILTANGGTSGYTWSVGGGALPAGLNLSSAGVLSGTPTASGPFTFIARAQDSSTGDGPYAGTRSYSFNIAAVTPVANPVSATVSYNSTSNPITLSLTGGAATTVAVATNATNGNAIATGTTITYTPTAGYAGPDSFTYTATNVAGTSAPATVTITVSPPTLALNPASLPSGTYGVAYSQTTTASGGTDPYAYDIAVGLLPAGLGIDPTTGVISGTPTAIGTSNFTVRAQDQSTGPSAPFVITRPYSVTIAAPVVTITSPSAGPLPGVTGGVAYSHTFTASGGQGSHSFALTMGTLPAGVTLSGAGVLSGTPTETGTFGFSVQATDASPGPAGPFNSTPIAYTLTVTAPVISVSPASLPNATTAVAYSETVTATGGTTPHSFTTLGTLPTGLTLTSAGVLSGTPTAAGTFNFTIVATDALGFAAATAYTFVTADPVIAITSPSAGALPAATGGTAYSQSFTASGGQGSHSFAVTAGATPPGVTLSPAGVLSGTPAAAGTFNFAVTATDSSPAPGPFTSTPVAYSLTVAAPTITLSPATLPSGTTALAYTATSISASGGIAPHFYSVTAGALPTGLILSGTGTISGTPTAAGTFGFTITASDAVGFTGSQAYSITISDPVVTVTSPTAGALPNAEPGVASSPVTFSASGGQGSHSFAVASGALPAGMTLSPGGVLSGTPTVTGTFNFSVAASDSSPAPGPFTSAAVAYSLTITDTLPPALVGMPANIVIEVDYPVTGAVATWTLPTATDNQTGATVTQTAGLASGATFPLGTTTNTYEARDIANNIVTGSFTVTVTQHLPGQVTMLVFITTDGAFGFTSSEPALNFTVNTASGSGTSGVLTIPVGNHGIAVSVPAGVEIASVSCTDPASSIDPATLSGTISVTAGAVISCTISSADPAQTTGLIGSFLEARSELILANEPDSSRRIERLTGAYSGQGGVSGFGLGFTDERMPFALSFSENEASFGYSLRRSQAQGTAGARIASAHNLSAAGPRRGMMSGADDTAMPVTAFGDNAGPPAKPWPVETGPGAAPGVSEATNPMATPFDIWIEGKIARFDANNGDGRFGIMHAGVDYLVTPRILVGLGAQLDWTDMDGSDDSTISGTGYLVGSYVTARLTDNLFLDGRAAWGQSANDVSPFGTYTDKLDATRWLVSLALIGQYDIDRWRITPKAKLAYFEEETDPYVDGLGLYIPAISIATGTLEFGPSLSYRMELANGMLFEPFATLEGIWTFRQENTATAATSTPGLGETGLRGRGELGFRLASQSASALSSSIFYDGLGNKDFQSWGGKLRFNHRF